MTTVLALAAATLIAAAGPALAAQSSPLQEYSHPLPTQGDVIPSDTIAVRDGGSVIDYTSDEAHLGDDDDATSWQLVAETDKATRVTQYEVHWNTVYLGDRWHGYQFAVDVSGKSLPATPAGRDSGKCRVFGGCYRTELVRIPVTRAALEPAARTGLSFTMMASDGRQKSVDIPGHLVTALLAKVDGAGQ